MAQQGRADLDAIALSLPFLLPRPGAGSSLRPFTPMALLVALPLAGLPPQAALPGAVSPVERSAPAAGAGAAGGAAIAPAVMPEPEPYRITPERRALLNTIRFAEGTWTPGSDEGYRLLFGGGRFSDLRSHPDVVVRRGHASAAAGAYQFLPHTWRAAARSLGLKDFRPGSQDQAALWLAERRGALRQLESQGLSRDLLARLAPEWASLPTQAGGSYYGQPVKSAAELQAFYSGELARQRLLLQARSSLI